MFKCIKYLASLNFKHLWNRYTFIGNILILTSSLMNNRHHSCGNISNAGNKCLSVYLCVILLWQLQGLMSCKLAPANHVPGLGLYALLLWRPFYRWRARSVRVRWLTQAPRPGKRPRQNWISDSVTEHLALNHNPTWGMPGGVKWFSQRTPIIF